MWDDLLPVAASVKGGHATAAMVVGKLCSSKRQQSALTSAIKEYRAPTTERKPPIADGSSVRAASPVRLTSAATVAPSAENRW